MCQRELKTFDAEWIELSRPALFAAGKAFTRYRRQDGSRTGVLPDFFIGAHAQTLGARILTRDEGRYGT